ncbi:FMN-binding protein [Nitrospina gracilis]|uniref:FMN-binding protein n=1 Tax=Nitrospina gracilis TaxID=35801 RepID=UPI001F2D5470|nr:FMN-binding protein [Nitrospina gracilis]MCF8720218.1 Na+-translocating ferredoxin:NAD+ oxidoreductase RnfG subunit [Nitrospina gracilis Nb-211]
MNKLNAKKPNPLYGGLALIMLAMWIGLTAVPAHALSVSTKEEALQHLFPGVTKVIKKKIWLSEAQRNAIARMSDQKVHEQRINVYVGMQGSTPLGYAVFETVKNRSWPISYVTVLNQDGSVKAVEVLSFEGARVWRGGYESWAEQFQGKKADSDFTPTIITGATVSARVIANGVKKAVAVYKVLFLDKTK